MMDTHSPPQRLSQTSPFEWLRIGPPEVLRSFDLIIENLGGPDAVSTIEAVLAKQAASTGAIIKLLDERLSGLDLSEPQASPLNHCRQLLAESLARYFYDLGLADRAQEVLRRYDPPTCGGSRR